MYAWPSDRQALDINDRRKAGDTFSISKRYEETRMVQNSSSILTVDAGTSSLKSVLYGQNGGILASATQRYNYSSGQPGWAEADPEDWWNAFRQTMRILKDEGHDLSAVTAIAFSGQMHTAVLLDGDDEPLKPTILWLDRRAAAESAELSRRLKLPPFQINSTYTLPKLLWLYRHRPEVIAGTRRLLWVKDYMRFRLTGTFATDATEPGGAALLDWQTREYAAGRLELAGLPDSVLPPIYPPAAVIGYPRADLVAELGLNPEAKVITGMGDVAALIAGAPPKPGRVVCSLGSSSMIFAALGETQHPADPASRLYTYPLGPYRLFGGVSSTTGAALVWIYNSLLKSENHGISFEEMVRAALQVPAGAEGLCFIPYLAGERTPYWSDEIRGGFYGLQLSHDWRHMVRAVMEGIAFSLRHLLDLYEEMGVPVAELSLAGGGTRTTGLPQIIADACGRDIDIYTEEETVTRVLYALCQSALGQGDFNDILLGSFPQPEVITHDPKLGSLYQSSYRTYRQFAAFAFSEAERVNLTHSKENSFQ
jgi:xylulokinase